MVERAFEGGCHCGALQFTFASGLRPLQWLPVSCPCAFCRAHGVVMVGDPAGRLEFNYVHPEYLRRYRFGLRTADYLICRECGVLVGAVMIAGSGPRAAFNVHALRQEPRTLRKDPATLRYRTESAEDRRRRQSATWTPVVGPV
jgi:hypothetical protein